MEVWRAIDAQRHRVAGLLEQLSDDEWEAASLCEGWRVRDVAAHLTLQQVGPVAALGLVGSFLRARGNLDRATQDMARRRAASMSTPQMIAAILAMVGSRRHNVGVTCRETLIDILVHGQDIAIPLGRELEMAPDAAAAAASRIWTMRWPPPFPARRAMHGLRLCATDTSWAVGGRPDRAGPDRRAPAGPGRPPGRPRTAVGTGRGRAHHPADDARRHVAGLVLERVGPSAWRIPLGVLEWARSRHRVERRSLMCQRAVCRSCGKATYRGCGSHVEQVLAGVPRAQRCDCDPATRRTGRSWLDRLRGR